MDVDAVDDQQLGVEEMEALMLAANGTAAGLEDDGATALAGVSALEQFHPGHGGGGGGGGGASGGAARGSQQAGASGLLDALLGGAAGPGAQVSHT